MDPTLTAALADVARIKSWCSANKIYELPHKAVDYLANNEKVLVFFISALYDGTTEQRRSAIHAANGYLDYAAIYAAFRGIAESTLHESIQQMSGNPLSLVTDDDVNMLLRVLEYVPHIDDARLCPIALSKSPLHLP